jgi:hypothetical protein
LWFSSTTLSAELHNAPEKSLFDFLKELPIRMERRCLPPRDGEEEVFLI